MGFGKFDNDEHKKREEKKRIRPTQIDSHARYNGEVTTDDDADTSQLLEQLGEIKEETD